MKLIDQLLKTLTISAFVSFLFINIVDYFSNPYDFVIIFIVLSIVLSYLSFSLYVKTQALKRIKSNLKLFQYNQKIQDMERASFAKRRSRSFEKLSEEVFDLKDFMESFCSKNEVTGIDLIFNIEEENIQYRGNQQGLRNTLVYFVKMWNKHFDREVKIVVDRIEKGQLRFSIIGDLNSIEDNKIDKFMSEEDEESLGKVTVERMGGELWYDFGDQGENKIVFSLPFRAL